VCGAIARAPASVAFLVPKDPPTGGAVKGEFTYDVLLSRVRDAMLLAIDTIVEGLRRRSPEPYLTSLTQVCGSPSGLTPVTYATYRSLHGWLWFAYVYPTATGNAVTNKAYTADLVSATITATGGVGGRYGHDRDSVERIGGAALRQHFDLQP
jgi:hypothetical protein